MMRSNESVSKRRRCRGWLPAIGAALWLGIAADPGLAKESSTTPPPAAPAATEAATDTAAVKLKPEQLDALVAPIALYPDELLAQTLVASTYPLELVQLQQWLAKHKDLKEQALIDSVAKQPWDPSIQSMAAVSEVVDRLANDIQWTTSLGNAFLAQQADVFDAVQRMRTKAKEKGALESNEQQKVETKVIEEKTIIIVESANPEVIYVPSYSPTIVYGPPPYAYYPYPPIYYPPYYPGTAFVAFGVGMMWGAAWGGSCCGCGWHGGNVNININNNFNNINNINNINGGRGQGGGGNWQHNPSHRGAAPYGDKGTASKYGGATKGGRGTSASNRAGSAGVSNRASGAGSGNKAGSAGVSNRAGGTGSSNRAGSAGVSNKAGSSGSSNRYSSPSSSNRSGSNQIGNRSVPSSKSNSGFSGGSKGYSGSSARSSSSRGSSSRGGSYGGGGSRGGGGRRG